MSPLARRRDGRKTFRRAEDDVRTARRRRTFGSALSGATARGLLDGSGDGPPPLPELLAAATAPATAAELDGEAAARAAFRSSAHAEPAPLRAERTARARTATAIVTAKIIAALALTAGTAGGVALATNSYSAHLQQDPSGGGAATSVSDVVPTRGTTSTSEPSVQTPDGPARSDSSTEPDGRSVGDGSGPSPPSGASSPGPWGPSRRCEAGCATATGGAGAPPVQPAAPVTADDTTEKKNNGKTAKPEKKSTDIGKGSDKEKTNNGVGPGKEKKNGNNGGGVGNSDGAEKDDKKDKKDDKKNDKAAEKGSGKKKADAGTTT